MKKISIVLIIAAVGFASCKKGFLDVNKTPNNPTAVPPSTILPNVEIGTAFANGNDLNRATSAIMQHIAGVANQTAAYDVYLLDGSFDNQWNSEIYGGSINNLQVLINQHAATSPGYSGIAKLLMAYVFSMATDIWGDVPYSQAGKGLLFETPRFDAQADIYQGNASLQIVGLLDLVKDGLADLAKPAGLLKPAKDDLVYSGDLTKWTRMGNTLLLKLAMQMSNRNAALSKLTIQAVVTANNYINTNALDFEVPFGNGVGNRNPIFDFNNNLRTGDQMLSSRLLALSRSYNDTVRLAKFFTKPLLPGAITGTPTFVAFDNGSTAAVPTQSFVISPTTYTIRSKYNTYLTGSPEPLTSVPVPAGGQTPIRLLTNFQADFIIAEAMTTLGVTATITADSFYKAGIRANMAKVGMTAAEIDNYFVTNPTVVTLTGTTLQKQQQIITQKYFAWIGNGIEVFNDYRRTGFPVLALPNNPQGDNPNVIPTRLPYTAGELARNPNAPTPRPKTDVKVWWAL